MTESDVAYIVVALITAPGVGYLFYKYSGMFDDIGNDEFGFWCFVWFMTVLLSIAGGLLWPAVIPIFALIGLMRVIWNFKHHNPRSRNDDFKKKYIY